MAKYYRINKKYNVYHQVAEYPDLSEHERGLDEICKSTGKQHKWLVLPQKKGQKKYVMCLVCLEWSHF